MTYEEQHQLAHDKAVREMTAEKYLLSELADAEAEAFEAHYFDCIACDATVRAGTEMLANAPEALKSKFVNTDPQPPGPPPPAPVPQPLPFPPRRQQWLATAAAATLAFVLGNAFPLIERTPAVMPMAIATRGSGVIAGDMRSGENGEYTIHFEGNRPRIEQLDISADDRITRYSIELRAGRKVLASIEASASDVRNEEGIQLLLQPLPVGRYELSVEGVPKDGNRSLINRKTIVVK